MKHGKKGGLSTNTNSKDRTKGNKSAKASCPAINPLAGRAVSSWSGKPPLNKDNIKGL